MKNMSAWVGRAGRLFNTGIGDGYSVSVSEISKVGPGLFLSGEPRREDAGRLRDLGIRNVLSVARECHDEWIGYECDLQLAHIGFRDHVAMPAWLAVQAVRTLDAMLRAGPTLVHCGVGISRSPTVIALYWWASGKTTSHAEGVAKLQKLRSCVRPNDIVDEDVLAAVGRLRKAWMGHEAKGRKGERPAGV